ncbi:MAG: hypothetical protein KGI97_05350 [Alphaproteobacteria bacterium]|nr:hypothetical protein [Alphaproteobacteria bacterium]
MNAAWKKIGLAGIAALALLAVSGVTHGAWAQRGARNGTGPVATQCAAEIKQFCASKKHGTGDVRTCLEAQKTGLSEQCKKALETTGGGRGRGRGGSGAIQ